MSRVSDALKQLEGRADAPVPLASLPQASGTTEPAWLPTELAPLPRPLAAKALAPGDDKFRRVGYDWDESSAWFESPSSDPAEVAERLALLQTESQLVLPSSDLLAPPELIGPARLTLPIEDLVQAPEAAAAATEAPKATAESVAQQPTAKKAAVERSASIPLVSAKAASRSREMLAKPDRPTAGNLRLADFDSTDSDSDDADQKDNALDHADDASDDDAISNLNQIQALVEEAASDRPARRVALQRAPSLAKLADESRPRGRRSASTARGVGILSEALPAEIAELGPYQLLADQLLSQSANSDCPILAFTVPERLDEGSFSIIWLAKALAERELGDVLLVDANAGRLFLSEQAGAIGLPGFGDVLMGKCDWQSVILPTDQPHIGLAPIGQTQFSPGDATASPRWEELRTRYRFVLVDAGPACEAENDWLVPRCDAAYLVVGLGETSREAAVKAIDQFNHSGTRALGVIVANGPVEFGRRKEDRPLRPDPEVEFTPLDERSSSEPLRMPARDERN